MISKKKISRRHGPASLTHPLFPIPPLRSKKVKHADAPSASASAPAPAPAAAAAAKAEAQPTEALKRTVPQTPTFMRRPSQKRPSMTSEERELEEIEQKRREASRLKRRSRRSFRAVHSVTDISGNEVQRSEKELTQPEPFHFATDERLRARGALAQPEPFKPKMHTMVTRGEVRTGPTKPRPFRFHGKPTEVKDVQPFVPMAAAVEMFQKQTPQRFRHGPAKENVFKPQVGGCCMAFVKTTRVVSFRRTLTPDSY
jgi:hypothetical protein